MERFTPLLEAFDYLDLVLAVFGATIVAMWFGRGKNVWGLLSGALVGGLVKPAFFVLVLGGAFLASQNSQAPQIPLEDDPLVKFWLK